MNVGMNSLLDSAGVAMVAVDSELRIQYANRAVEDLFQCQRDGLGGQPIVGSLLPEHAQSGEPVTDLLQAQFEATSTLGFEAMSILPDGGRRWCVWTVNRQRDSAGVSRGLIAVATDVTEQRQAESVTQTQNRILAEIAEGASPGFLRESICKLIANRVTGARCSVHDRSVSQPGQWDVVGCGLPSGMETTLVGFDVLAEDVSSMESAVEPAGVHASADGVDDARNTGSLLGKGGHRDIDCLAVADLPDEWLQALSNGEAETLQTVWRVRGGEGRGLVVILVWFEEGARRPTTSEVELLRASIALCLVLAERDLAQLGLRLEKDRAVSMAATLGAFMSRMSREVRAPLGGVIGILDMLRDRADLPANAREPISTACDASQGVSSLLDDILDMAMIETGELSLHAQWFDPQALLDDTLSLFGAQARSHGVRLLGIAGPDVPLKVYADAPRIRQVLVNLLSNATRFTRHGQIAVELGFEFAQSETDVLPEESPETSRAGILHFSVRDNGIGMSAQAQKRVFECQASRLADTRADKIMADEERGDEIAGDKVAGDEGAVSGDTSPGLGLPLSRRLVELMGGSLELESELGSGSEFRFNAKVAVASARSDAPLEEDRGEAVVLQGKRVLTCALQGSEASFMQGHARRWGLVMEHVFTPDQVVTKLEGESAHGCAADFLFIGDGLEADVAESLAQDVRSTRGCAGLVVLVFTKRPCPDHDEFADSGMVVKQDSWVHHVFHYPVSQPDLLATLKRSLSAQHAGPAADVDVELDIDGGRHPTRIRVLVVEDQEVNRAVAAGMLRKLGTETVAVAHGQLAVDKLQQEHFDLVLMDCEMPIMDGYTATRCIRDNEASTGSAPVTIVAMSAHAEAEQRAHCEQAGMDDYLSKPYKLTDLQAVLDKWCPDQGGDSQADTPVESVLVEDELAEIMEMLGDDFAMLVDSFLTVAPQKLQLIEVAMLQGDTRAIKAEAHALKGIASTLAARRLAELCQQLEASAGEGDRKRIRELREPLAVLIRRSSAALRGHLADSGSVDDSDLEKSA